MLAGKRINSPVKAHLLSPWNELFYYVAARIRNEEGNLPVPTEYVDNKRVEACRASNHPGMEKGELNYVVLPLWTPARTLQYVTFWKWKYPFRDYVRDFNPVLVSTVSTHVVFYKSRDYTHCQH